ncbi:MAG: hypothetical protein AAGU14_09265 [Eubacteriaceae bacterium]
MKPAFKKTFIIILFVIFLVITQWFLWSKVFIKHNYIEYNSLDEFIGQNINSDDQYMKLIAENNEYAVCLGVSNNMGELYILLKTNDGKWELLSKNYDYKKKSYTIRNNNSDFVIIHNFEMKNNNQNIIIVWKIADSKEFGKNIFTEDDKKLKRISDSQNTKFYYRASIDKTPGVLNVIYTGFIKNFDTNNYVLYINDNEYPYSDWGKLFNRY